MVDTTMPIPAISGVLRPTKGAIYSPLDSLHRAGMPRDPGPWRQLHHPSEIARGFLVLRGVEKILLKFGTLRNHILALLG